MYPEQMQCLYMVMYSQDLIVTIVPQHSLQSILGAFVDRDSVAGLATSGRGPELSIQHAQEGNLVRMEHTGRY